MLLVLFRKSNIDVLCELLVQNYYNLTAHKSHYLAELKITLYYILCILNQKEWEAIPLKHSHYVIPLCSFLLACSSIFYHEREGEKKIRK